MPWIFLVLWYGFLLLLAGCILVLGLLGALGALNIVLSSPGFPYRRPWFPIHQHIYEALLGVGVVGIFAFAGVEPALTAVDRYFRWTGHFPLWGQTFAIFGASYFVLGIIAFTMRFVVSSLWSPLETAVRSIVHVIHQVAPAKWLEPSEEQAQIRYHWGPAALNELQ